MCASSRRAWWESSAEAPLFAHHTRSSSSLPRTRLLWCTTRRHAASATAQFISASRRPRTSSVVRGRRFLLRTVLGLPRWGTLARPLSPSLEMPAVFGRQVPILACPCCDSGASSASAFENTGCCGKKRTAFAEKSTVFRANSPTFHENKQRPPKKAVKRNFKLPSADLDVPHFPLTGRSVEGRNSPLSGSERARFAADRPLSAKRHRTSAHPLLLFSLSLPTNPKNQEACSLPLPHIHRKSTPNGALLRPKHQVKRNLSNKIPYYNACFSKIHLLPLQHIQYNKAAFPNGRRIV